MIDFLPPVLMGEARQQQQVVLCWDTRTTQPCTPLVKGVVWEGVGVWGCVYVCDRCGDRGCVWGEGVCVGV